LKFWLALLFAVSSGLGFAQAQGSGDSDVYKKVLDSSRVRVFEVRFKPGAKAPLPGERNQVMYVLTDGSLVFIDPGKRPYEVTFRTGEAVELPLQSRVLQNDTEQDFRAVIVEMRDSGGARTASAAKAKGGKAKAKAAKGKAKKKGRGKGRR
jgi:hypothetical protein